MIHPVPIIMGGRDQMGFPLTGLRKTGAFLQPIIDQLLLDEKELIVVDYCAQPQAVIVALTPELTLQIFHRVRKLSHGSILKIAVAYEGTALHHQEDYIAHGCHILVATPGSLQYFVDCKRVSFESIRFVVLDEADRILDMDFMPSVVKILMHETMVSNDQYETLMFSATFPEDIQQLGDQSLNKYVFVAVGGASAHVPQTFHEVEKYDKLPLLTGLIEDNYGKRFLVFVANNRNADFIAAVLSEQGLPTSSIHSRRMQREREEALDYFEGGHHFILVVTDVGAQGLDIENIDIVVNFDLPKSIDKYVHRIGRTGRVGNRGKTISFFDAEKDGNLVADLAKILRQADQDVPDFLEGGGTATYKGNKYGGSDVRSFNNTSAPAEHDDDSEEEW